MDKKNLTNQANDSVNSTTEQNLSAEMIELSDEALSQMWGGSHREGLVTPWTEELIWPPIDPLPVNPLPVNPLPINPLPIDPRGPLNPLPIELSPILP